MTMIEISVKTYSRAVGIFLILTMVGGWFGEVQIPSQFMTGDAATTAAQLRVNEGLFRLGFAAYLVEAFSDLVLAWLFYVLLKRVHRDLALLSAFFGIVSMSLFAVTKMFYFSAPMFLKGSSYLTAFSPEELETLAKVYLSLYGGLSGLFMLFYGTAWIIRGYLTFRSSYLPRFLGVLMVLAGIGFVAKNITKVLAPAYSSDLLLALMFLNVLVLAGWMIVRGVDQDKWDRAIADPGHPKDGRL
jgi:glucan phosphoethanolaminetransferase (alkaline phosphatase superfamily)